MEVLTVYTTPTCPWCNKVKAYLKDRGVDYQEVDVTTDYKDAERMIDLTGQRSVPVITKGDQYVVGFDPDGIERMLQ